MAAEQRSRRKKLLYASSIVAGSLLGAISLFLHLDAAPVSEKSTRHVIAEKAEQAYLNEWPDVVYANEKSTHSQTSAPSKLHQPAESTKVSPVSEKSLLHLSIQKQELNPDAVEYIRAELMEIHTVTFKQAPEDRQLLAMHMQPIPMNYTTASGSPKKNFDWYLGVGFNPQLSNYDISQNAGKFNAYDGYTHTNYVDLLRKQSKVYSYNAGIKGGFTYKQKWMVEGSVAYQSFRYMDKQPQPGCYDMAGPVANGPVLNNAAIAANTYRYMNFSVQASRLFEFKNVGVKTGVSFSASHLISANTVVADGHHMFSMKKRHRGQPLNQWVYAPGLHIGLVKNLSDRVQMQASPNVYYNLNSMFNKNYIVSQKPYGVGLDLSLMIRIN